MISQPPVFIDSVYLIALTLERDQWHEAAERARELLGVRPTVTTDGVISEFLAGTARAQPSVRYQAASIATALEEAGNIEVVEQTRELMNAGIDAYRGEFRHTRLSLQDCIAILVMRERGIMEALTADQEFLRAGITPLMVV